METITSQNASVFVAFAGSDPDRWKMLIGQKVTHPNYGAGVVVSVEQKGSFRFRVRFGEIQGNELTFTEFVLAEQFKISLPEAMYETVKAEREKARVEKERREREAAEAKAQLEREAKARRDFARLKEKYQISYSYPSPVSRLYQILLGLEESSSLVKSDIEWLEAQGLFDFLARLYENRFRKYGDGWDLVKASSHWRTAGSPDKALDATKGFSSGDKRLMAAVLTTRGGAFRDINALTEAEDCARKALTANPDSVRHAYNLLGAICYQRGSPEEGDKHFEKAGITPDERDRQIRDVLAKAGRVEKTEVARYLLRKDPKRYEWAKYYLQSANAEHVAKQ